MNQLRARQAVLNRSDKSAYDVEIEIDAAVGRANEALKGFVQHQQQQVAELASEVASELSVDAVGTWQIVRRARAAFPTSEPLQFEVLSLAIQRLLAAGAQPVFGSRATRDWHVATEFQGSNGQQEILAYMRRLNRDPDFGDLWFALPEFIEQGEREA